MQLTPEQQQELFSERPAPMNPEYEDEPEIVYGVEQAEPQSPNSTDADHNTNASENPHTKREIRGAAVAGGLAGLLVGGPIVGALAAGGAALAVTSKGQTGKVARAGGEAVACVGDRLKKIDKKHKVVEKTGKGVVKGCNWVSKKLKPKA